MIENENNRNNGFQYKNPLGKPMTKEAYKNWVLVYDFPDVYNKEGKTVSFIKYSPREYDFKTLSCTEPKGEVYEGMTKDEFFDYEKNQGKSKELLKKFGTDKDRDNLERYTRLRDFDEWNYNLRDLSHNEICLDSEIKIHQYADEELLNKVNDDIDNGVYVFRRKNIVCGNTVYISSKVKEIGIEAFAGNSIVSAIYVEDNDIKIEEGAFRECYNLTNVHLPEQLKELPKSLFVGDYYLDRLKLPQELEKIGNYAFSGCTDLNFIHIPHGVKEIGDYAFADCDRIIDISFNFNDSIEKIGAYAFVNAASESDQPLVFIFPDTLKEVGEGAFENATIGYLSMTENTMKSINIDKAFKGLAIGSEEIRETINELDRTKVIPGIGRYFVIEEGNAKVELHIDDFSKFKESVMAIDLSNSKECIAFEDMMKKVFLDYNYDYDASERTKLLTGCIITKLKESLLQSDTEEAFIISLIDADTNK